MGIRVNKVLGYGLTNLSNEGYKFASDQRFDPDGYFALDYEEAEERYSVDEFIIQLKLICANDGNYDRFGLHLLLQYLTKTNNFDFHDILAWESEYEPETMVFVPPSEVETWQRRDDIIDYMEDLERGEGTKSSIIALNRPIYPYDSWMDLRNPTEHPDFNMIRVANAIRFNRHKMDESVLADPSVWNLKEEYGFDSLDEMLDNIVPGVPEELIETIRFLKVFKDPNAVYQLRPMIYTFWS